MREVVGGGQEGVGEAARAGKRRAGLGGGSPGSRAWRREALAPGARPFPLRAEVGRAAGRGRAMATEGDVELELETEPSGPERPPEKPRKHDSGAADLERVTDYAEEKEIQSSNLETVRAAGSRAAAEAGGARARWD